jgi:HEAT repeat protein
MTAETSPPKKYIAEILDHNEPLAKSELNHLSTLSADDLEFLKQFWQKTNTERKREIILNLIRLGQNDFKLNFSEIFLFCLHDPDPKVRAGAIVGLEEEESYQYISPMIHLLEEDSSAEVREAAVIALGKFALLGEIGKLSTSSTKEVYHALLAVLDDKSTSIAMQCLALEAIAPLNLPRIKGLIEKAYHSNNAKFKASAIRAMGRNCNLFWLTDLLAELRNNDAEIRYEAANSIGEIGSEEALPNLQKLLQDEDARVQEAAIRALGKIGSEQARLFLNKLTRNPEQRIRQAAKSALKELDFCEGPLSPSL